MQLQSLHLPDLLLGSCVFTHSGSRVFALSNCSIDRLMIRVRKTQQDVQVPQIVRKCLGQVATVLLRPWGPNNSFSNFSEIGSSADWKPKLSSLATCLEIFQTLASDAWSRKPASLNLLRSWGPNNSFSNFSEIGFSADWKPKLSSLATCLEIFQTLASDAWSRQPASLNLCRVAIQHIGQSLASFRGSPAQNDHLIPLAIGV